jgi:hypothetical protein
METLVSFFYIMLSVVALSFFPNAIRTKHNGLFISLSGAAFTQMSAFRRRNGELNRVPNSSFYRP